MLEFLSWKLTLLALVVCLSETQCAPPGTTTRIEYELICDETIAAVSLRDCQSCPVEGCKTELLRAGCWEDSDHWYKSCMGGFGPCIRIKWEESNDGSYSNNECQARCPGLYETCVFMPVVLTTTLKVPIAGPAKIAPADTSMTVGPVIGVAIACIAAVAVIVAAAVFGIKKLIERRKIAKKAENDENPTFATDGDPANNIPFSSEPSATFPDPSSTENAEMIELMPLGSGAQAVNRQADEDIDGPSEHNSTSLLLRPTSSHFTSSISDMNSTNNNQPPPGQQAAANTALELASTENAGVN